jgi:hypothetical protein
MKTHSGGGWKKRLPLENIEEFWEKTSETDSYDDVADKRFLRNTQSILFGL